MFSISIISFRVKIWWLPRIRSVNPRYCNKLHTSSNEIFASLLPFKIFLNTFSRLLIDPNILFRYNEHGLNEGQRIAQSGEHIFPLQRQHILNELVDLFLRQAARHRAHAGKVEHFPDGRHASNMPIRSRPPDIDKRWRVP
jgi:hypothetical protein